jgi:hypothetical protein
MSVLGSGVSFVCARVWGIVVTAKPLQRRVSSLCHRSDDCVTTRTYNRSLTVLKHPCCCHPYASGTNNPCSHRASLLCVHARVWGIVVTAKPLQRRVSSSCHRSDDCVTTTIYERSLTVLKHPYWTHPAHTSGTKCPCLDRASL